MSINWQNQNDIEETDDSGENEKWECYLCAHEETFSVFPGGYLANYHPLCESCANEVLYDDDHEDRFRLSYHFEVGDFEMISNIPVPKNNGKNN